MAASLKRRFGRRIKELRHKSGLTQVELADKLGLSRSYLADIEAGNRNVGLENLKVLADGFDLNLSELFLGV